jgi:hypothetical protein
MPYVSHKIGIMLRLDETQRKKARKIILDAYLGCGANGELVAAHLGATRRTLGRWVQELGMGPDLENLRQRAIKEGWYQTTIPDTPTVTKRRKAS